MPSASAETQVAPAGIERDRGRHGAGVAADVAADDDDGPDFGDGAAKSRQKRGQQALARHAHQRDERAQTRGAIDQKAIAIGGPKSTAVR